MFYVFKDGMIVGIGKAGNPDIMDNVIPVKVNNNSINNNVYLLVLTLYLYEKRKKDGIGKYHL